MLGASALGLVASFWQLMEKLTLLKDSHAVLSCNLNSVFSCSSVLNSHQASVFGPPNALIGVMMFTFFFTVALAGTTGSQIVRRLVFVIEGLALFMLGFTLWFLYQSAFNIHALCIFCTFVGTAVVVINAAMLRQTLLVMQLKKSPRQKVDRLIGSGADLFAWVVLWLAVALTMFIRLS